MIASFIINTFKRVRYDAKLNAWAQRDAKTP